MKIVKRQVWTIVLGVMLSSFVLGTEVQHKKDKATNENGQYIRPNVADLNNQMKIIKPYIEKPFIAQEVDRISQPKRKIFGASDSMTNAILLGAPERRGGLEENPSLWTDVISSKKINVVHPVPQPVNYAVHPDAANAFAARKEEAGPEAPLTPGAYSIPVKIEGGSIQDPTLSGYETPNFIHKGERTLPDKNIHSTPKTVANPQVHMQETIQKDIQTFMSQLDNAKDKSERIQILLDGKNRLNAESKALAAELNNDFKELLSSKEVAIKLHQILGNYEAKMRKEQLSKLKLADEVTIKNLLRDKIQRELQGFRTSPGEYKELEVVNPADIAHIMNEIKLKIGQ